MGSNQEETLGNGEERRAITKNVEVIEKIETIKKIEKKETMETREREEPQEDGMSRDMEDMEALERRRIQKRREHMLEMRRRKRRQEVLRSWTLLIAGGLVMAGLAVWGLARLVAEPGGEEGKRRAGRTCRKAPPGRKSRRAAYPVWVRGREESMCLRERGMLRQKISPGKIHRRSKENSPLKISL